MSTIAGSALIAIGSLGVIVRALHFVRVTMPENYGRNPGFGAFESMALPWWGVLCGGVGFVTSVKAAAVTFFVGLFTLGLVAQLLDRLFGRSS
jgi:hypothetical protein